MNLKDKPKWTKLYERISLVVSIVIFVMEVVMCRELTIGIILKSLFFGFFLTLGVFAIVDGIKQIKRKINHDVYISRKADYNPGEYREPMKEYDRMMEQEANNDIKSE